MKRKKYCGDSLERLRTKSPSDFTYNGLRQVRARLQVTIQFAIRTGREDRREWAEILHRKFMLAGKPMNRRQPTDTRPFTRERIAELEATDPMLMPSEYRRKVRRRLRSTAAAYPDERERLLRLLQKYTTEPPAKKRKVIKLPPSPPYGRPKRLFHTQRQRP